MTDKQAALKSLEGLSDDASVEDAIERLYVVAKVCEGLRELDAGKTVPHDEVKRRLLGG
jgi:predicted transcriptional regulator